MNVIAIVQARLSSVRLPKKILMKIKDYTIIELLLNRLSKSIKINRLVVATTINEEDLELCDFLKNINIHYYRGSEHNVLKRYYECAVKFNADVIVRITGDCPLVDPEIVDKCINLFLSSNVDYTCNRNPATFPDGLDVEVFSFKVLQKISTLNLDDYQKEHVTPYIYQSNKFKINTLKSDDDYSFLRLTLDEKLDFQVLKQIIDYFHPNIYFGFDQIVKLYKKFPQIFEKNKLIMRNEGALMSKSSKLWKRAKAIIPGGNMLLSKRPEMFLPDKWPAYFKKSKKCFVWDIDNKKYIDFCYMGVGTNILGYANPEVDIKIKEVVQNGNMSSLNCPDEVYLAEKLINLHPWADMAKFARSGAEANAIALRIARASSGKDGIAFCGYHGWHDWYLSSNIINKENLSKHLLSGLPTKGVPNSLRNTSFPFEYNKIEQLKKIINNFDIGTIIMEVERNEKPQENFLLDVRKLADKHNIVLIFDECSSGFRKELGGLHLHYGVFPDIAMFGKALGNGYAINAVIGKKNVMQEAQSSFISSTFWTERIGYVAGLETLKIMERDRTYIYVDKFGEKIKKYWKELAHHHQLPIKIKGINAISSFDILLENSNKYKTLITQEMLKKGWLASNTVYSCVNHNDDLLTRYVEELDKIFRIIIDCENGKTIDSVLESEVCHVGFGRLN